MARPRLSQLSIIPLENGSFQLAGYYDGTRIRKRSRNLTALQEEKARLESNMAKTREGPSLRSTWLTAEELKLAEAATLAAMEKGGDVLKLVSQAASGAGVRPVKWADAIDVWAQFLLNELKRFPRTVEKNKNRLLAFRANVAGEFVHEATQGEFERHVLRPGVSALTQLTDGAAIRAFFNFALRPTKRWCAVSPVSGEIMRDLAARAAPSQRPVILTVAECRRLLEATAKEGGGRHLPYVVLATWCFLRHAEAVRVKAADLCLTKGKAYVQIDPRKRGTPSYRVVTIPENARVLLVDFIKRGLLAKGVYFERRAFEQIRAVAGIDERAEPNARGYRKVIRTKWQENILRHTGISYLYQKSGDIHDVCRQAGNSGDTAFKHYLHLPERSAAKAFYASRL